MDIHSNNATITLNMESAGCWAQQPLPMDTLNSRPASKSGHWSEKEQAKYYAFLCKFEDQFNEKESRRQCKVFKAMAGFIRSRDANQCRSHHHKMTKSFDSIHETLESLKSKYPYLKKRS